MKKSDLSSEEKARLYDELQSKKDKKPSYRDRYTASQSHKKSNAALYIVLGAVVVMVILVSYLTPNDGSPKKYSDSSSNKFLAYSYAERFVKRQLKAPSTAKFPGTFEKNDHITQVTLNEYKIVSWVDSQNGFGAMIRTNFSCIIKFNGDQVTCNELELY